MHGVLVTRRASEVGKGHRGRSKVLHKMFKAYTHEQGVQDLWNLSEAFLWKINIKTSYFFKFHKTHGSMNRLLGLGRGRYE